MILIKLYEALQSKGYTQRQLAQETGVRESAISVMCNNQVQYVNLKYLNDICAVLNCSIEDILEFVPDEV